jgi:hypothetical protein
MGMVIATRRRAADFDALVEGSSIRDADPSYAGLLELVGALRTVPEATPRAAFVADLRSRLMVEAATALVPSSVDDERLRLARRPTADRPRHPRRVAALVSGVAVAGVTTSMAFAAQTALPGDLLYPVKRGVESVHAAVAFDNAQRGGTVLASARDRLAEVSQLSAAGHDSSQVAPTLDAFSAQASTASDLLFNDYAATGDQSSIAQVRDFTATSMTQLAQLQSAVPADALDELLHAATVLQAIEHLALQACPGCPGASVTTVPTVLTESSAPLPGLGPFDTSTTSGHPGSTAPPHVRHHHSGGPDLPDVHADQLPPGSVNVGTTGDSTTVTAPNDPIGGLTGGLTSGNSSTDTGSDPTSTLLDAVGQAADTAGGVTGGGLPNLPTSVPSDLPTELPTSVPSQLPTGGVTP